MAEHTPYDLPWRLAEKISVADDGCWNWTAFIQRNGYGKFNFRDSVWLAHRVTYTMLVDEIPEGLVIDHLCRNRACVNPAHLRAVTQRVNTLAPGSQSPSAINAAKSKCPAGHDLVRRPSGTRSCVECVIERDRQRWPERSARRSQATRAARHIPAESKRQLLADAVDAFGDEERLTTPELMGRLMCNDDWRPRLETMTPRARSQWFSEMVGVKPRTHRFNNSTTKGYRLSDLTA